MPSYQFNNFTGRLKESTHPQPFYPLSPNSLQKVDPPTIMYDTIKTKPAKSASSAARYSTVSPKFLEVAKKLQADLEFPVFLGLGKKDKIFFAVTSVALALASINSIYLCTKKKA